jgi:hypothetical protein
MNSSFGPKGRDLIFIGADNRISLWDVDVNKRRKVYIEKKHLAHNYTCCAWSHGKKDELGVLAVGCSDGVVLLWDLARGVVANVIGGEGKGHEIADVVFSQDGKTIFTCSVGEPMVNEYTVADGALVKSHKGHKKGGASRLAGNPKTNALAVGGAALKIMETASNASGRRKLEGHFTGNVGSMVFAQCGRYLACCANDSQEVLVYDVHADAASAPIVVFSCDENVAKVVARSEKETGCVDVLCVLQGGGCALARVDLESKETEQGVVVCGTDVLDGTFVNVNSSNSSGSSSECNVVFALKGGAGASEIVFQKANLNDATGALRSKVGLAIDSADGASSSSKNGGATATAASSDAPTVLGPMETGPNKRPISEASGDNGGSPEKRRREGTTSSENGSSGGGGVEATMEERLKRLTSEMSVLESSSGRGGGGKNGDGSDSSKGSRGAQAQVPTSDSLVTLLDQALLSGDDTLLEQCISCEDSSVIDATAQRLPAGRVVSFMKRLVSKFEKRPSRGILLTRWLAAVLRAHTAFLISVPELSKELSSLSAMLENRLSSYTKLAALGGRLDLLLAQVTSSSSTEGDGPAGAAAGMAPVKTVVVPEDDDDED